VPDGGLCHFLTSGRVLSTSGRKAASAGMVESHGALDSGGFFTRKIQREFPHTDLAFE
jgi:hypothetical protein